MLDSLVVGVKLAFESQSPRTQAPQKVAELLGCPFLAKVQNFGATHIFPEFRLDEVIRRFAISNACARALKSSRIVAYGQGVDTYDVERVSFLYYNSDDTLILTEIQKGISYNRILSKEGVDDTLILEQFLSAGFVPYLTTGTYPVDEEL